MTMTPMTLTMTQYMTMTPMTLTKIILSALAILGSSSLKHERRQGCAALPLLPDKPFLVVWNYPSSMCQAKGVNLNFEKWGIVDNSKDSFFGDQIALFYQLGQYPHFFNSAPINGGLPQLGNLTYHLQKAQIDISKIIPSLSFSGLGVIDFESWRPLLILNFDALKIYEVKSLELAQQRFPYYNKSQLWTEAIREFEEAARSFMQTTLQNALALRPSGKWGYYGYPRCWDSNCSNYTAQVNDQMGWVYKSSTGLYPSIYYKDNVPDVHDFILETLRVRAKWSSPDAAIFPYSFTQSSPYDFYTKEQLAYTLQEPADIGSSGVVLWGSYNLMRAKNECLALQSYINNTLGPYTLRLTNFFANCSEQLCQSHGRCVRKDYEKYYQYHLRASGRAECRISAFRLRRKIKSRRRTPFQIINSDGKAKNNYISKFGVKKLTSRLNKNPNSFIDRSDKEPVYDFDDYICKCFVGWSGPHCEIKSEE